MPFDLSVVYAFLLSFVIGSIPFGVVIASVFNLGNLRQIGSGNVGATNVLRTGNKTAALLTLLLDGLKGAVGVWIFVLFSSSYPVLGLLAALLGHCFSPVLKGKGGKGVATLIGGLFALSLGVGLIIAALWLAVALITRLSSLAGIAIAIGATICLAFMQYGDVSVIIMAIGSLVIIIRHKDNIKRIFNGTESKIGQK